MHSDKVLELDKDKLLNNSKVTSKRRYAEDELRKIYSGYKKSSYHAEEFVKNIDIAIKNEKEFCEDIQRLKDSIGSNIGILIEDMRSWKIEQNRIVIYCSVLFLIITVYNTPRNHEASQKHPQALPHEADKLLWNDPDPSS